MTVAAIDCGTNTIRLLVGGDGAGWERRSRIVRLGEGVDATGRLAPAALARTFAAVEEYAALVARHGVPRDRIRFCATSATRDAINAEEFAAGVLARLGVRPEVLSGTEEAALGFAGATRDLVADRPVLVVDVGGGSTELTLGDAAPTQSISLDVGSVRLHERHLRSDPPTPGEVAALVADVDAALDTAPVDLATAATVVGVAGTVLTLAAMVLDLPAYDGERVHQAALPVSAVREAVDRLVSLPVAERARLPFMAAGREDVIAAGGLIVITILARCRVESLVPSRADLLDGIARSIPPVPSAPGGVVPHVSAPSTGLQGPKRGGLPR